MDVSLASQTVASAPSSSQLLNGSCSAPLRVVCRRPNAAQLNAAETYALTQYARPLASAVVQAGEVELVLYDTITDQPAAQQLCGLLGGTLAELDDDATQAAAGEMLKGLLLERPELLALGGSGVEAWLGLTATAPDGGWQWGSGGLVLGGAWAPGQPSGGEAPFFEVNGSAPEDCATLINTPRLGVVNLWQDVACTSYPARPLCQRFARVSPKAIRMQRVLPVASTEAGGSTYTLYDIVYDSWSEAHLFCQAHGGRLAGFDSSDDVSEVGGMVSEWMHANTRLTEVGVWFGANDR
ncbi:hypothetical protein HYH03_015329 [Edaphochlamys debaryana]|uniref:C-type lectin domain-containing protein n=1 Tax=Edaphochlamys debaryana TaxID=47281 RepID=A0A835XLF5_9CHLO|nr:hypothetical protein HYH03_015329 [Edaphochlamys debaryana]|eukprot:KAG2486016.1 hypothetical protein HYH03_015329 [Edaphochlamys debaryana]